MYLIDGEIMQSSRRIRNTMFFNHFFMGMKTDSTMVNYFTSLIYMKDWCKEKYPNPPANATALYYDNCALSYVNWWTGPHEHDE